MLEVLGPCGAWNFGSHAMHAKAFEEYRASFSVAYQNLTACLVGVWYTESYRNVTLVAFGRCLVYQVT